MKISYRVRILNLFRSILKLPFLERSLSGFTQGKPADHIICKLVPNPYQYKRNSYRFITRNGLVFKTDISDYIGHYIYFGFTDVSLNNLFELCEDNYNVLDVGANIGWTALNFAKICSKGKVVGFEPDLFNFNACKENIGLNKLPNLTVLPFGLGDIQGNLNMEIRTPDNRGGNRIALQPNNDAQIVQVKRLDEVEEILFLPEVNLIKIDVEGFELKVLRGGHDLLKRHKPILFIEIDNNNLLDQGDSAQSLVSYLELIGYRSIYHAETLQPISTNTNFENCHFDIIAR